MTTKNFDLPALNRDGTTAMEGTEPLLLSKHVIMALDAAYSDEPNLSKIDKLKRDKIARKVFAGGEQDYTAEELGEIDKVCSKAWPPLILAQICAILDH
jgi:hypothetical protein